MILGEAVVYIKANMMQLTAGLGKAQTATKLAMGKMTTNVKKYEKQIKSAGKMMGIAGALITGAFALMVKSAISFEEQMAQVSTMLDESAMSIMPEYSDALQAMSVEFGEATSTLSKGLYDILSASIPPAEALDVLGISAQAAVAGITDTGVAADAITTVLNSYGMEASEAATVSDQLFAIVKGGKTTFGELAPAIGKAAATASMSGLSFEDLGASISTITRAGIGTDQAMTAIVGVLKAFLTPMDSAIDAAEEFGLELNTTTLKTIGLTGVMGKLKNASAEQLAAIFGNIRELKGIAAALGDVEGYARDLDRMYNSLGLTQAAFDKQSATLGFQLKRLKQSFNVIAVTIGDILIPTIKKMVEWGLKVTANFKKWTEKNKPLVETLTKVGVGLGIVLLALAPIALILPGIVTSLGLLKVAFLPFLVGGLIVAGLIKINSLLDEMNEIAYKAQIGLEDLTLADLDKEIENTAQEIKRLEEQIEITSKLPLSTSAQHGSIIDLKNSIMNLEMKMGLLIERRNELTKAQEDGIDTTEELTELEKEAAKLKEDLAKAIKDEQEAVKNRAKAEELANLQTEITNKLYELSHTAREIAINDLDILKDKYIKAGVAVEKVTEWYDLEIEKLGEVSKELKTGIKSWDKQIRLWGIIPTLGIEKYLKKTADRTDELSTETIKLNKELGEQQDYFAKLPTLGMEKYLREVKDTTDELGEATKPVKSLFEELFLSIVQNAGTTFSILEGAIQGFMGTVESSISDAIVSLLNMKKTNQEIKDEMAKKEDEFLEDLERLWEEYNTAVALGDDALAESILGNINSIKTDHEELMGDMEGDMTTIGSIASTFWESLKTAAVKALADIIAKMLILKGLMLLFGWLGLPLSWLTGFEKGGGVEGFAKGGQVKGFATGGGTDTVPAMLTPGEYVISKPMVDYIKRSGNITGDLVDAIQSGTKTPTGFAGGGGVSPSRNITIGAGAIVINTPKFSEDDAQEMFEMIERQAKNRGLEFANV